MPKKKEIEMKFVQTAQRKEMRMLLGWKQEEVKRGIQCTVAATSKEKEQQTENEGF